MPHHPQLLASDMKFTVGLHVGGVTVGSDVVGLAVGSVGLAVGKLVGERLGTDDVGDSVGLLVTRLKICPS